MRLVAKRGDSMTEIEVQRRAGGYLVRLGDREIELDLVAAGGGLRSLRLSDGRQFVIAHQQEGNRHEISFGDTSVNLELFDPLSLKRRRLEDDSSGSGVVTAMMPGRVVRTMVAAGDRVQKGAPMLILEAMKMENEILSPRDGTVVSVAVEAGQTVESGAELVVLE